MMRLSPAAAALSGLCMSSPAAASGEGQTGLQVSRLSSQAVDPSYRPGQAISPGQLVEIEEASYAACLQGAARHYGALAGRAGPGAAPGGDPYADCRSAREAWKKALMALDPAGGPEKAEEHIDREFGRIAAQTTATWQQAFNDNNYR